MTRQTTYRVVGLVLLLMGCGWLAAQERSASNEANRLAPNTPYAPSRNLSRFFAKIQAGQPVVVMGIGGSVTEGHSWAAMSAEWLQKQPPGKQISYVDGAYGGAPPWQTVFRLCRDGTMS